ncbi:hypothetical protein KEM56_000980 [Ascosphaera pollenicola]|nr:hypothetical protein KEM56_000980 [Ascosphaera pollenicola]
MTDLALAKTSLLASLLRPDPDPLARPAVDAFYAALLSAVRRCSYTNIQTCKDWITTHIVPSKRRTVLFARYIVALAKSFDAPPKQDAKEKENDKDISARRKQLHLLYLLHDVLHHVTFHHHPRDSHSPFADAIIPSIATLLHLVASTCEDAQPNRNRNGNRKSNIHSHLHDLLTIWEKCTYFPAPTLSHFRKLVTEPQHASVNANDTDSPSKQPVKNQNQTHQQRIQWRDAPYILPATHGDPALPYHELPAANLLPHIKPNSTAPILPSAVRPLLCAAGPARKELVAAVKNLLGEVDELYADGDAAATKGDKGRDISELGEIVVRDAFGEIMGGETYYGWSRGFCKSVEGD